MLSLLVKPFRSLPLKAFRSLLSLVEGNRSIVRPLGQILLWLGIIDTEASRIMGLGRVPIFRVLETHTTFGAIHTYLYIYCICTCF